MRQACTVTSSAAGGVNTRFDHDPIVRCTRLMATQYVLTCVPGISWPGIYPYYVRCMLFCSASIQTKPKFKNLL